MESKVIRCDVCGKEFIFSGKESTKFWIKIKEGNFILPVVTGSTPPIELKNKDFCSFNCLEKHILTEFDKNKFTRIMSKDSKIDLISKHIE